MITDATEGRLPHGWANAWNGDPEMEGMRVRVDEVDGLLTAGPIHPDDADAALRWDRERLSAMRERLTVALRRGEVDMVNDEGEDAWQTPTNSR